MLNSMTFHLTMTGGNCVSVAMTSVMGDDNDNELMMMMTIHEKRTYHVSVHRCCQSEIQHAWSDVLSDYKQKVQF